MPENFMVTEMYVLFYAMGQYEFYFKNKCVQFRTTT